MEALLQAHTAHVEARLVRFRAHKETLLSHLREAHSGRNKGEPFSDAESWRSLETVASIYFRGAYMKPISKSRTERRRRYQEIAGALRTARRMIEELTVPLWIPPELVWQWWQRKHPEAADRDNRPVIEIAYIRRQFQKSLDGLAIIEAAAEQAAAVQAAQKVQKGRPRNLSLNTIVLLLAFFYYKITRLRPGAGK